MTPRLISLLCLSLALGLFAGCDADSVDSSSALSASTAAQADAPAPAAATAPELLPAGPDGKVHLTEAEWRARLTPEQYQILREAGTERAFCGAYWKTEGKAGFYHCAACGVALFDSTSKFDSGTGWPSFGKPVSPESVIDRVDTSHGMRRVENICARCESHLGHVFPHESSDTGLRYCMNSASLVFVPAEEKTPAAQAQP
jgi:peptide-methionine (R)-S-oxide reductase